MAAPDKSGYFHPENTLISDTIINLPSKPAVTEYDILHP